MKSFLSRIVYLAGGVLILGTIGGAATGQVRFVDTPGFGRAVLVCPGGIIASQKVMGPRDNQLAGPGVRSIGQIADLMMDDAVTQGMVELQDNPFQGLAMTMLAGMKPAVRSLSESMLSNACNR